MDRFDSYSGNSGAKRRPTGLMYLWTAGAYGHIEGAAKYKQQDGHWILTTITGEEVQTTTKGHSLSLGISKSTLYQVKSIFI